MPVILDKKKIAQRFLRSADTYDSCAAVQQNIASTTVQKTHEFGPTSYECGLEIGCCTGVMTEKIVNQLNVKTLYINDLVAEFESRVMNRLPGNQSCVLRPMFGDIEQCNIPSGLDLIISGSTFQWFENIPTMFHKLSGKLNKKGILAISLFTIGTFKEINSILGISLNYTNEMLLADELSENFNIIHSSTESFVEFFSDGYTLLRHLRDTGVGGLAQHKWTRKGLNEFDATYRARFKENGQLPLSYVNTTIICEKK